MNVGIDIKDIPKIDDKDFSVTLNAFFVVQWTDERLLIDQEQVHKNGNYPIFSEILNVFKSYELMANFMIVFI